MLRNVATAGFLGAVLVAVPVSPALAQYGYGWGGWGGGGATVQGNVAAGRGVAAAGAGQYNMDTSVARSINAQTAQQWNDYMYACQQRNNANAAASLKRRQKRATETLEATYKRLHDNPEPRDIHTGDALNVVLTELVNPKVYTQVVRKSRTPIDSKLVMNIDFQYASNMILLCLEDVYSRVVPEVLTNGSSFDTDRTKIRALIAKGKQEAESSSQPSPATLKSLRDALAAAKKKADAIWPNGSRQRTEVDNFFKGLIGLTKLLERPQVEQFLKGLKQYPQTTMGQLIDFMHGFNLRFGVAKTPEQEAAYDEIYPMLVQLRDEAHAGNPNAIAAAEAPLPDPRGVTAVFSDTAANRPQPPAPRGTSSSPPKR
jgi:hypothetical protein